MTTFRLHPDSYFVDIDSSRSSSNALIEFVLSL